MPDPKTPRENTARSAAIRRWAAISGPLMFVVVVVAVIFAMSVFFRISDIQVEGNVHYTDQEIIRAIDIEEGDNLFFFDRFAAIGRAFSKLPYIETVTVERSLPNKVIITVEESTALAYLELGDEKWTLDHSCKVLGRHTSTEYKFGMLVSAMEQLKEGDVGILDVSDGAKAHFTPN